MRVAFVTMKTTHFRDSAGARRFERVAGQLADRGHDVTVFCRKWWAGPEERVETDGITYRAVTVPRAPTAFAARIPVLLALHRPDVIHVRPDPPMAVRTAAVARRVVRAPLVAEWYGDEAIEDDRYFEAAATEPDVVVTPSEMVRTAVREVGANGDSTKVIPEGIDWSLVRSVEPADPVEVVYAHPLTADCNAANLLLGLAELRQREWSATIIGDGPERGSLERQAADLRIGDRISFVGDRDRRDRVAIYKGAHAFVQTARRVSFAREFLWALACGCVGIVEYQAESSAHELVENHERSFRVTDPHELAEAIADAREFDRLVVDDAWAAYDHAAVIEQYLETYRRLRDEFGVI